MKNLDTRNLQVLDRTRSTMRTMTSGEPIGRMGPKIETAWADGAYCLDAPDRIPSGGLHVDRLRDGRVVDSGHGYSAPKMISR